MVERLSAIWNRLSGFGIVARLAIIFLGVGGLVVAASIGLDRSVLVERTTQTLRTAPPPTMGIGPRQAVPTAALAAAVVSTAYSQSVLPAVSRFDVATHERIATNSESSEAEFQRSNSALDGAAKEWRRSAASTDPDSIGESSAALKEHQRLGKSLVLDADDRRDALRRYSQLLQELKMRDKASLDKAWKIFGRVVTRQSLLQLDADLHVMVRTSGDHDLVSNGENAAAAALRTAEAAVQKDLDTNEHALVRSEGADWFAAMRGDVAALVSTREGIARANQRMTGRIHEFSQETIELTKRWRNDAESRAVLTAAHEAIKPIGVPVSTGAPAFTDGGSATALPKVIASWETTKPLGQTNFHRDYLIWFCALVVALLTYVAVGTAISIIVPVRRLVRATSRLSQGDGAVRLPRGGLKELDTVAVAFNQMAEEITTARRSALDYQKGLEQKVDERTRQLQDLAQHDPLTGLPNRRELSILLTDALTRAEARHERVALFFLDIDNFKYINDSMGHIFGDRVLIALAQRLQGAIRPCDFCARLGGDEFTVVLERAPADDGILVTGNSIVNAFHEPLCIDGRDLIVRVSVGAGVYPEHGGGAEELLKAADAALFRAKILGRGQLSVFTPDLLEAAAGKFTMEQDLRRALERGEFELVFQPEISAATLKPTLVEALLRWRAPDGRLVSPADFLAVAEESGLIMEIGDWVLRSAVEAAAHWHHGAWAEVCVAINVSPRQFIDAGFVDRLCDLLHVHRLPSRCIEIELTESVLQTGPATMDALKRLRSHGVAIALDDFGTGYSSLASLEQLPLTRIKLDRSLVSGIDRSPRAAAVAHAIIGLCQGLGLDITAEGVERPEQFSMLASHRSMHLQGYLLAHPAPRDELIALLARVEQRAHDLILERPQISLPSETGAGIPRLHIVADAG